MASLEPSPSSQPLDYSLPPSAKRGKYPPVVVPLTTPTKFFGKQPRSLSQKAHHQQGQQQNQLNQFGPTKPNKNLSFGDGLELHSGYSDNMLEVEIHSYDTDGNGVRSDFSVIVLSAKEFNTLKDSHGDILDDTQPSFDSPAPESTTYDISSTLKITVELKSGDYVVSLIRQVAIVSDAESSVKILMEMDEFVQLGKSLKLMWFVFSKYPKNLEKSPMARKMLDRMSVEMIRMITDDYPEVISFDYEELQNPDFASAFFKAYSKLTNFGYIHTIATELAKDFDKDEYDLFSLLYQCAHQIELLCTAMNALFKSQNK
jgi:hypothetical protein